MIRFHDDDDDDTAFLHQLLHGPEPVGGRILWDLRRRTSGKLLASIVVC